MIIPWQSISPDALHRIIEHFVLREGTDYGEQEVDLQDKVAQVHAQLMNNQVAIVYSELHDTVDIKTLPLKA